MFVKHKVLEPEATPFGEEIEKARVNGPIFVL
jgi:hypothetical protein